MLTSLFPTGATIGEKEIHKCVNWIDNFLNGDEQTKDIKAKYDMSEVTYKIKKKRIRDELASRITQ